LTAAKILFHISSSPKSECNTYLSAKTSIIDESSWTMCFGISPLEKGLGHDYYAFPGDLVFLDEFTEDSFGVTLRVGIGCIEGLSISISFKQNRFRQRLALIPAS
jgi:hypothetical protein